MTLDPRRRPVMSGSSIGPPEPRSVSVIAFVDRVKHGPVVCHAQRTVGRRQFHETISVVALARETVCIQRGIKGAITQHGVEKAVRIDCRRSARLPDGALMIHYA